MSRFLFTTLPTDDFGLLTRSLPIARELKARGHEVLFCHPARGPQILISEAGFQNLLPKEPLYFLIADSSPRGLLRLLGKGKPLRTLKIATGFIRDVGKNTRESWNIDDIGAFTDKGFFCANVEALREIIASCQPDAVVDFWNPWACVAARVQNKPLITVIQSHQHPKSPGFIWWKPPPSELRTSIPIFNSLLSQYGLAAVGSVGELFVGDLTLVVGMPETDPLPGAAGVTYIGAVLWQNPIAQIPEWIARLGPDQPVVWVYTGKLRYGGRRPSPLDSEVVLQASIEALAREDVQVVLTTGHQDLPRSYRALPDNFRYEPFVPGLAMARRSDLMIHHGGYGSCQTGLYAGTPAVIIPTISERESNARRVVEQGAGEMVLPTSDVTRTKKKVDSSDLAAKVHKVLSTPSYKENTGRVSAKLKRYGGAARAAQLIEEAVKTRGEENNRLFSAGE